MVGLLVVAGLHDSGGVPIASASLVAAAAGFKARHNLSPALVECIHEKVLDADEEMVVNPF